ncbi:dihydrolipoamide acetyltransferase family protein [Leucobacter aridicollis]|uniref:dihydrolipoamide acetyltransferase family protein n=1 Tax=Leucobacter aridicollis TaxID=283878 RepID=UPI0031E35EB6
MIDILMPRLSDTMTEGTIAAWRKQPGDRVEVGDIIVEIETDKALMEQEAYEAGVLSAILTQEGEQARIGEPIARLDDGTSGGPGADQDPERSRREAPAPAPAPAPVTSPTAPAASAESTPRAQRSADAAARQFSSPLVRRLARERGIDLAGVVGSGPGGRIVRADIPEAAAAVPAGVSRGSGSPAPSAAPAAASATQRSTVVPFDATRAVIARRLSESSSEAPHFAVTAVADVTELLALRATLTERLVAAGRPKLSVTDLLVRAAALALREVPGVNASYSPEGRGATVMHERVHVGLAVASASGLVVPVIRDADRQPTSAIAAAMAELTARARAGRLTVDEMTGGTFTISNLGMYGVEQFTAVINPPEGAILAVGAAVSEPVVVDGEVVVRERLRYTLSADHRIIDGALAAEFLRALTRLLENPVAIVA